MLEWTCRSCNGQGKIDHPTTNTHDPICVVCSQCQSISAYLWCPGCGLGGQLAANELSERPTQWVCQFCQQKYDLPAGFFDVRVHFTPNRHPLKLRLPPKRREEDLPPWMIALDGRWKRFGEPLFVVCVIVVIFSIMGLALTVHTETGLLSVVIFSTFCVVFSSLVVGVMLWGGITLLLKWIMLHTPPEPPKKAVN